MNTKVHRHRAPGAAPLVFAVWFGLGCGDRDEEPRAAIEVDSAEADSLYYIDEEIGVVEETGPRDVVTIPNVDSPQASPPAARHPTPAAPAATAAPPSAAPSIFARYQMALARKPSDPLLLNNYAWELHLAGRYEEAEQMLRQVIDIAPDRAIAYANLGETLWKQGRNSEAASYYQRFLELNTNPRREAIAQGKLAQITGQRP